MAFKRNVLLCYRGRFRPQVEELARKLGSRGLSVTYDHEILARPGPGEYEEVDWISLSSFEVRGSSSWRAPLKEAIGDSELVVFLVDPHDQSLNLINEFSWVAKAGRHAFYIFDVVTENVSPDAEGFYSSFLSVTYALALNRSEVPGFDYLLLAHQDPNELDARLDVAVNRIQEHLERVRIHPVPDVRLDTDITLRDVENLPVVRARKRLADIQQKIHERLRIPAPQEGSAFLESLDWAFRQEKGAVVEGKYIRPKGSPFRYPLESERRRYLRTQRIIERARPEKYERPPIFALLARQAASIELIIEDAAGSGKSFQPAVALGTIPVSAVDDVASVLCDRDYALIMLDAAFIDFVYQVTKVTVCAWKLKGDPNRPAASFSTVASDVEQVVRANPALEEGLWRCVRAYAIEGMPAATIEGAPPPACQTALGLLIGTAERFMIGRGYAQLSLMDPSIPSLLTLQPPKPGEGERERMLKTDIISATYVLASAARFDTVDPAIALQGCGMPIVCADLIHRAVALLDPTLRAPVTQTPSFAERRGALEGGAYLTMSAMNRIDEKRALGGLTPAHMAWQTAELLWSRVAHRMEKERENGARPAWIWR